MDDRKRFDARRLMVDIGTGPSIIRQVGICLPAIPGPRDAAMTESCESVPVRWK